LYYMYYGKYDEGKKESGWSQVESGWSHLGCISNEFASASSQRIVVPR
jgi:hypothetical protein